MKKLNKNNLETIGKYVKKGSKIVACGLVTALSYVSISDVLEMINDSGDASYSDAVNKIMSSSMWSSDKEKAVAALKQDGDSEFYKAIIKVVGSSMYSDDKVKAIKMMCVKE